MNNLPFYPKPELVTKELCYSFKKLFFAKHLGQQDVDKIIGSMIKKRFKAGDHIIRYGDQGKSYYVLMQGNVKVVVYNDGVSPFDPKLDTKIKFTKMMQAPVGFGEIALLYNDKRTASIFAEDDCEAYELDGKLFK